LYPAQFKKAAPSITTPSGGIGRDDFRGLGNFSELQENTDQEELDVLVIYITRESGGVWVARISGVVGQVVNLPRQITNLPHGIGHPSLNKQW
jgi:hypothetical protein